MNDRKLDEERILQVALTVLDAAIRSEYLDQVCAGDQGLRDRVEALLEIHEKEQRFLRSNGELTPTTNQSPVTEAVGGRIGRYKLLDKLGEGGMGIVFLAEQQRPVRQRVAVKIIKQGMDTGQFIARFEAERQALALMDHPNIARFFDAGCTDAGRPYFVMELVKGIAITKYCDDHHLTARARIALFTDVCRAVQHAHQKGIIHRDLKPSNVLVALYDDRPVPKIIDFGVAKATNQILTERTMFTQVGQIVGTWQYMSPEQAVLNQLDVDTRSDIYSLGVILYELLTGVTPLESHRLHAAAFDEVLRIIRNEEPLRPSTRVTNLGETATANAASRGTSVPSLAKALRGDLDCIVMKALEKDRSRRYENANSLAADLNRYLNGEPIEARPASAGYRLRKAATRHRSAFLAATAVILTLVTATVVSTGLAVVARREADRAKLAEQHAREAADKAQLSERKQRETLRHLWEELTLRAMIDAISGDVAGAQEAIGRAKEVQVPEELLLTLDGLALFFDEKNDEAIRALQAAAERNPNSLVAMAALYHAYVRAGRLEGYDVHVQLAERDWQPKSDPERILFYLARAADGTPDAIGNIISSLDDLIARRQWWGVAYLTRATALAEYAMESRDLDDFRKALADVEKTQQLMPDSMAARGIAINVTTRAIECARDQLSESDVEQWRIIGEQLATKFKGDQRVWLTNFYTITGQPERANAIDAEYSQPVNSWKENLTFLRVGRMFRERNPRLEEILRRASDDLGDQLAGIEAQTNLAIVLLEKSPEGRSEARKIYESLKEKNLHIGFLVALIDIPLLLGDLEEARRLAGELLEYPSLEQHWRWWRYLLDYLHGVIDEQELVRRAGPFSGMQSLARYYVALRTLANGERQQARDLFERVTEAGMSGWYTHEWSKVFVDRMKEDRTWPNWIPTTGENSSELSVP